jgi:hypothetical protein
MMPCALDHEHPAFEISCAFQFLKAGTPTSRIHPVMVAI